MGESMGAMGAGESGSFAGANTGAMAAYRAGEMGNPNYIGSMSPTSSMSSYGGWQGGASPDWNSLVSGVAGGALSGGGHAVGSPGGGGGGGADVPSGSVPRLRAMALTPAQIQALMALAFGVMHGSGLFDGQGGGGKR